MSSLRSGLTTRQSRTVLVLLVSGLAATHVQAAEDRPAQEPGQVRIATCQFPVSAEIRANAQHIRRQMREARGQGADVAHFCESALTGYPGKDMRSMQGFDWDRLFAETETILALAKELKLWVVLGSAHRLSGEHKPHNCLYIISPDGRIVDRYDKRFCTSSDLRSFTPGDHFTTFEINGVKCGALICYDQFFPELYREYCRMGVRLMFHSFYHGRQKEIKPHIKLTPQVGQAHALMNHMYISNANSSQGHIWPSHLTTPDGLIASECPLGEPAIIVNLVDTTRRYHDSPGPFRKNALSGTLHSGQPVTDERSENRTGH